MKKYLIVAVLLQLFLLIACNSGKQKPGDFAEKLAKQNCQCFESSGNLDIRTSLKKQDSCRQSANQRLREYCQQAGKEDSILAMTFYAEKNKPCKPTLSEADMKSTDSAILKLTGKVWIRKDGWTNSIFFVDSKRTIHFIQYKNSQPIQVQDNLILIGKDSATIRVDGNYIRVTSLDGKSVTLRQAGQKDFVIGSWYGASQRVRLDLYSSGSGYVTTSYSVAISWDMKGNSLYVSEIGWVSFGLRNNYQIMNFGAGEMVRLRLAGSMTLRKMMNE